MYRAILKETVCASITKNGEIIATGLGILDRDYIASMPFMYVKIIAAEDMPVRSVPVFSMRAKKEAPATPIFKW